MRSNICTILIDVSFWYFLIKIFTPTLNPGHSALMLQGKDVLTKEEKIKVLLISDFQNLILTNNNSKNERLPKLPPLSNLTTILPHQTYLPQKFHGPWAEREMKESNGEKEGEGKCRGCGGERETRDASPGVPGLSPGEVEQFCRI